MIISHTSTCQSMAFAQNSRNAPDRKRTKHRLLFVRALDVEGAVSLLSLTTNKMDITLTQNCGCGIPRCYSPWGLSFSVILLYSVSSVCKVVNLTNGILQLKPQKSITEAMLSVKAETVFKLMSKFKLSADPRHTSISPIDYLVIHGGQALQTK